LSEDGPQVPLVEDQDAVGEFASGGQHEAFGEAVRPRTAWWDLDGGPAGWSRLRLDGWSSRPADVPEACRQALRRLEPPRGRWTGADLPVLEDLQLMSAIRSFRGSAHAQGAPTCRRDPCRYGRNLPEGQIVFELPIAGEQPLRCPPTRARVLLTRSGTAAVRASCARCVCMGVGGRRAAQVPAPGVATFPHSEHREH
jgi:hypothetical protein